MLSICLAMLETGPDQRRFTRFFEAREKKSMRWPCGSWEIPTEKTWSTLIWTDPETGICFRIRGNKLSKETMLRMAESVEQGSAAPWSAEAAAGGKAPASNAAPSVSGRESAASEKAAAQAGAERAKQLEEAQRITCQNLDTASKEMRTKILEARKVIINSVGWVADGYEAYTVDPSGKKTPLPHLSDLFPGWELPAA